MNKKKQSQEYGKPYTPKDFRQVGIGMIAVGIIVILYGISVYQHGSESQMIQTKGGNKMYGTEPENPLYIIIAIAGGISSVSGIFLWIHGKKTKSDSRECFPK